MQLGAQIEAFFDLLEEILTFKAPADRMLDSFFRQRRYAGSKDRKQITMWLYTFLRHYGRLSWQSFEDIPKKIIYKECRLLGLAYFKIIQNWSLEDIKREFQLKPYYPEPLTQDEILFLSSLKKENPPEWVLYECPSWLLAIFKEDYPKDYQKLLLSLGQEASCDLRVNTLKTTRDVLQIELAEKNIQTIPTSKSPFGLRLQDRLNLTQTDLFKKGYFEIQDEGSQLIAQYADPKEGDYVIDLCAGAGGKTLAFSALMNNKGRIVACDISEQRLAKAQPRLKRAGVSNVQVRLLDEQGNKWLKKQEGKADLVLIDAPCSGTGTWRRNPDHKWRLLPDELEELIEIQQQLLAKGTKLVKKGGKLVYATCSLLFAENENQINFFLKNNKDFFVGNNPFLKILPFQNSSDGFFAASLIKIN